jgi:hypothetical protein
LHPSARVHATASGTDLQGPRSLKREMRRCAVLVGNCGLLGGLVERSVRIVSAISVLDSDTASWFNFLLLGRD